ncbi:MAG: ABC transporter permease [Gemmataceae bacterium]
MKLFLLTLKNLKRNPPRTAITALAMILLVALFCMIATVIRFLDNFTQEKTSDIRLIITDRFRIPSRFDRSFVDKVTREGYELNALLEEIPGFHSDRFTVWAFTGFTLDPQMKDKDQMFFVVATEPEKIPVITEGLRDFDVNMIPLVEQPPRSRLPKIGMIMGEVRMEKLGKRVGDVFKARSFTHHSGKTGLPIEMEFEIVGTLARRSRWAQGAFMDIAYLRRVLEEHNNVDKDTVNLGWLLVDDQESAAAVSRTIEDYMRDVRCETLSAAVSRFMEPLKDFFWGLKFVVAPAIFITMVVIVSNAVGMTVRERTQEMAVLKVLGFSQTRILVLVLAECVLVGTIAGLVGGAGTREAIRLYGGITMGEGDPPFFVSVHAWWWGPVIGASVSFLGGLWPAWNACQVKVSQVFARVA